MFGELVIGYLFLGGAAGGLCMIAGTLSLLAPTDSIAALRVKTRATSGREQRFFVLHAPDIYRSFLGPLCAAATFFLMLASLLLMVDLGVMNNVVLLFTHPTPSLMTFGSYALLICMITSLGMAVVWTLPTLHVRMSLFRSMSVLLAVCGLAVSAYTGLLLSEMPSIPFWSSPYLPLVFVASSLACGIACVQFVSVFAGSYQWFRGAIRRLICLGAFVVIFEAVATALFLWDAWISPYEVAHAGVLSLLTGSLSQVFLIAFGLCGLGGSVIHGVAVWVHPRERLQVALIFSTLILLGGFALRYCIVEAGMHAPVWA